MRLSEVRMLPVFDSAAGGMTAYGHGVRRGNQGLFKDALNLRCLLGHPSRQLAREV